MRHAPAPPVPVLRHGGRERAADHAAQHGPDSGAKAVTTRAPATLGLGEGMRLPARDRRYFEQRLGADLSGVRVHRDSSAASRLGARAFAAGRDIGFAPGAWQPGSAEGRRLLGHELAHVLQQGAHGPAVQLEEEKKPEDAANSLETGVKVAKDAAKDDPRVKALLEPAKQFGMRKWDQLGTGGQIGVIGFGAATYGIGLGAGLSDPEGRKALSDFNLIAPIGLIPYATLTDFRYVLPDSPTGPTLLKASFSGDDLLGLAHEKIRWFPQMTLSLDFTWSLDATGNVTLASGLANWGVLPGINLQAGAGVDLGWKPLPVGTGADPFAPGPLEGAQTKLPGVGAFVTVDLLKAPILPAAVRRVLGAQPEK
ncbi:DUF4157 domain-containing protein [Roseomonas sp. AR75]|uniref:eCIS core domain-containing protein n=1 Tax=Roseomonas sp. AR75 TaxID=2562311 RepID=UPI0010C0F83E|nr:DUF4157 domain-containing protein [Roseomonas sp. AR75]